MTEVRNVIVGVSSMSFSSNGKCRDIYWPAPFATKELMHTHNAQNNKKR